MSIEIDGIDDILSMLTDVQNRVDDLTPIMREIGNLLTNRTEESFQEQRSPFGGAWGRSKRAQRDGGLTLIDTSRLVSSFNYSANSNSVEFGTNIEYAIFYHSGTSKMPKRKFIPISDSNQLENSTKDEILQLISRFLE